MTVELQRSWCRRLHVPRWVFCVRDEHGAVLGDGFVYCAGFFDALRMVRGRTGI